MAAPQACGAGQAADIHNRATALLQHAPPSLLTESEPADNQIVKHLANLARGDVRRIGQQTLAGHIGQKIHPTQFEFEPFKQSGGRLHAGDIVFASYGFAASLGDDFLGLGHACGIAVEQHHRGAIRRQGNGTGPPHATGSARHHRHLATQMKQSLKHQSVPPRWALAPFSTMIQAIRDISTP